MISREFTVKDIEVQFKADDTGELNIVKTDLANRKLKKNIAILARKFLNTLARLLTLIFLFILLFLLIVFYTQEQFC